MLCDNLEDGMLLTIRNPEKRGWLHMKSHRRLLRKFQDIPPKFVIGPDTVSLLMRMEGVRNIVKPGDVCIYLGKQRVTGKEGNSRTIRLVLVNGEVGFIEGRDIKHMEPLQE